MASISNVLTTPLQAEQNSSKSSGTADSPFGDAKADEQMFLKLLVAQLQNQDPASPADPMQFVSQLAQFTTLEQTIGMKQELVAIHAALDTNTPAATSTSQK